jgi:hypothetical protein
MNRHSVRVAFHCDQIRQRRNHARDTLDDFVGVGADVALARRKK